MPATTGAGRVKTRWKSATDSVTPMASMMIVRSVVTCGAIPVNEAGEQYAAIETSTAQGGNKRVTRASMTGGPWLCFMARGGGEAGRIPASAGADPGAPLRDGAKLAAGV